MTDGVFEMVGVTDGVWVFDGDTDFVTVLVGVILRVGGGEAGGPLGQAIPSPAGP